jgi:hypothetical protein
MRTLVSAGLAMFLTMTAPAAQAPPQLPDVLARAAQFVAELEKTLPAVVVEERYAQSAETTRSLGGSTVGATNVGAQPGSNSMIEGSMIRTKRTTRSELLLVRRPAAPLTWSGARNVLEVDGKPMSSEPDRLARLAADRAVLEKQWTALADESRKTLIGPVERGLHVAMCALSLLRADQQPRTAFKKDGEEKVRGTATWRVTFVEQKGPSLLRTSGNVQLGSRGTFWIDPQTGQVLRTRLEAGTGMTSEQLRVDVEYAPDAALGVPLPTEAKERYENQNGKVDVKVTFTGYRKIDTPK